MPKMIDEASFLVKFENTLGNLFELIPFDFQDRLKISIEIKCRKCEHIAHRKYYNLFKNNRCKACIARESANERNKHKLLTKKEFLALLPFTFEYEILQETVRLNHYVYIKNEFGICRISGRAILRGTKPSIENAVNKSEYRVAMYNKVHNNAYTYPDFVFKNNTQKTTLCCPIHGNQTVCDTTHLKNNAGCPKCNKKGAPSLKYDDFLQRISHLDIEILGEYEGYHKPILFKNKYGICKLQPGNILKGFAGSLRSATDKTSYMINQLKEKHGDTYNYDNFIYCGNRCYSLITCPIHGDFEQYPDIHLMGSGCKKCAFDNRIGGYSKNDFIVVSKGRICTMYIINLYNDEENFYKIGITCRTLKERFSNKFDLPYKYNILHLYESYDAGYIWDIELKHKNFYKAFQYFPDITFAGRTECFNLNLPVEEIISKLSQ